jgi:hypothetical protein
MKTLLGALAGLALTGLAAGALAQGSAGGSVSSNPSGSTSGTYGTGTTTGAPTATHRIQGRVIKSSSDTVTILSRGVAIPLHVQSRTSFQGVKSASDLKEGEQVRASFELKDGSNQLDSLSLVSSATGSMGSKAGTGTGGSMGGSSGSTSPGY